MYLLYDIIRVYLLIIRIYVIVGGINMAINFLQSVEKGMDFLHKKGAFLTVKGSDKVNTMTISWGNIGHDWGRPIFTVLVRKSRYTHGLIENSNEFTVSIPLKNDFKKALSICGTKSGRNVDKIKEANISLQDGRSVSTPVIAGCKLHYECKIVYKQEMNPEFLVDDIKNSSYINGDYHTIYFGEIVDCYLEEN
jgi:flavin reductase (DIM6/NTAB) family NADH-FMN oxidoreductase RutF